MPVLAFSISNTAVSITRCTTGYSHICTIASSNSYTAVSITSFTDGCSYKFTLVWSISFTAVCSSSCKAVCSSSTGVCTLICSLEAHSLEEAVKFILFVFVTYPLVVIVQCTLYTVTPLSIMRSFLLGFR